MKKFLFGAIAMLLLTIVGCRNDDFNSTQQIKPVPFKVITHYDRSYGDQKPNAASVTITNLETQEKIEKQTDANGEVSLSELLPGEYNVSITQKLSAEKFLEIFGYNLTGQDEITFNGSQEKVVVNSNTSSVSISLTAGTIGSLVLKQIYYAGSDVKKGAVFRDQFVEIFNNSNEVQYADGLYFAQLKGNGSKKVDGYTLANGQYDWSKSPGNSIGSAANTDYVYAIYVYKIPGTGKQYPINPGESIVIAATAINHKEPILDNSGNPIKIEDPELTVDLKNADFEGYLGNYRQSIGQPVYFTDIDNPSVPDLEVIHMGEGAKDFLLNPQGRESMVIFRATEVEVAAYPKVYLPNGDKKYQYLRLPNKAIIDGVDLNLKDQGRPKQLADNVDSQYTFTALGAYSSSCVMRKVKTTVNGRKILQDTNNSQQDFTTVRANPRGF
ncbi:DUF4876 domain-containing protein [Bergeyella cardium]|uniref:DUF4876 domain-containing protein n=1 Tax=Bergeyella cardium TaxID=1585976 RepID=UPI000EA31544|nr:DUF4876 domain-containing protein [Bergeyella cardium]